MSIKETHQADIRAILGKKVTSPKDLTIGRWYAIVLTGDNTTLVHALLESVDKGEYKFSICSSDVNDLRVTDVVFRKFDKVNGKFHSRYETRSRDIFKFATHPDKLPKQVEDPKPYPENTRARDIGAKVGDQFVVVVEGGSAKKGSIIELIQDDGTRLPWFKLVEGSMYYTHEKSCERFCEYFKYLKGYAKEPVSYDEPDVAAPADEPQPVSVRCKHRPAREQGLKAGDHFEVAEGVSGHFDKFDVIALTTDDNTAYPYFTKVNPDGTLSTRKDEVNRVMPLGHLIHINFVPVLTTGQQVDAVKAEIDRLNEVERKLVAEAQEKVSEANRVSLQVAAEKIKLEELLAGYLPSRPLSLGEVCARAVAGAGKPRFDDFLDFSQPVAAATNQAIPLSTGGIDPRPFGKLD